MFHSAFYEIYISRTGAKKSVQTVRLQKELGKELGVSNSKVYKDFSERFGG